MFEPEVIIVFMVSVTFIIDSVLSFLRKRAEAATVKALDAFHAGGTILIQVEQLKERIRTLEAEKAKAEVPKAGVKPGWFKGILKELYNIHKDSLDYSVLNLQREDRPRFARPRFRYVALRSQGIRQRVRSPRIRKVR
jgi:hypothetical protein